MLTKDIQKKQMNFANKVQQFQRFLILDLGGPKVIFFRTQVNFFKGTTFLWILFLMYYFENYSRSMYLYLFLHGTYGICWLIKDYFFSDSRLQQKASLGSQLGLFILLVSYWMIPVPLAAGYGINNPSHQRCILLVGCYLLGIILMMGSDYQKNTKLLIKKGLISDGFFKYTRNPNYLGQFLIYSSFVFCSGHIVGFMAFYGLGGILFILNIYVKDQCSYKRKEGWQQYKKRSYIFLPKIFQTFVLNFVFYSCLFIVTVNFLAKESCQSFYYPFDAYLGWK